MMSIIKELLSLKSSQETDILELMSELSPNNIVTSNMLSKAITSVNTHVFAIIDGERILGTASLSVYYTPTGTKASIEDVVVKSSYRGQHLGKKLMEHVISYAKKECKEIDIHLTSRPQRVVANELYKTLGFQQRETNAYVMRIRDEK